MSPVGFLYCLAYTFAFIMLLAATKLRGLSVYKLGGSTPALGESSDLLNADRDKNDYDWSVILLFL